MDSGTELVILASMSELVEAMGEPEASRERFSKIASGEDCCP